MKRNIAMAGLLACVMPVSADDTKFSTHLWQKFQVKACTNCHDFFEKSLNGLAYNTHLGRNPETCVFCHTQQVTGFEHPDEWFAQTGVYTSGMDAKQTCETVKKAMHAEHKSKALLSRQIQNHLFNDPRILWSIDGATPKSGMLPGGKKEVDLVKGGIDEWKNHVLAWIKGGMKCD